MKAKKGILLTSLIIFAIELLPYFLDEVIIAVTPPISSLLSIFISDFSAKIITLVILFIILVKLAISFKKISNESIILLHDKEPLKETQKELGSKTHTFKGIKITIIGYFYCYLFTSIILIFIFADTVYRLLNQSNSNLILFITYAVIVFFYFGKAAIRFRDRHKEVITLFEDGINVPGKGNFTWSELQVSQNKSNNYASFKIRLGYGKVCVIPQWLDGYTYLYKALYDNKVRGSSNKLNIYKTSLKGYKKFNRNPVYIYDPKKDLISNE
ncbi:hypothetical protein [Pseudoalteromonas sp. MMG024]|uniref:hypothetical protein n=1 Tax=Pseudoalteromonas sp. MMG024 TaxID=2909980 RepID=UPI001F4548B2|nr:hypothetical protein [Pseudoalteromonas sp. MMG024]MCF6458305.1 hypothetical protein [Pseudoalteromonas sp. MMG024]